MGGTVAISIKLREEQRIFLEKYSQTNYPITAPAIFPKTLHFTSWTNWVTWFLTQPELWVHNPTSSEVKSNQKAQSALSALYDSIMRDLLNRPLQPGPIPVSYGIILNDFEKKAVLSCQGYACPSRFYLSGTSTAIDEQFIMARNLANEDAIEFIHNSSSKGLKELTKVLKLPLTVIEKGRYMFFNGSSFTPKSKQYDGLFLPPESAKQLLNSSTPQKFDSILSFCSVHIRTKGRNKLYSLNNIKEPSRIKEHIRFLTKINKYLKENNWPERLLWDEQEHMPDNEALSFAEVQERIKLKSATAGKI